MSSLFTRVFILFLSGLIPAVSQAALENGKVLVGNLTGTAASIDTLQVRKPLTKGLLFSPAEGYRIETASSSTAELILSNGSTIIVSPDTLIEVKTFRQVASPAIAEGDYQKFDKEPSPSVTEIEVKRGKVVGEVRKLSPLSSYVIKTPVGMARIRGTVFTVGYAKNSNGSVSMSIACARGSVEGLIFDANTGPVAVAPGKQLEVTTADPATKSAAPDTANAAVAGASNAGKTADSGAEKPADAGTGKPADAGAGKPADAGAGKPADAPSAPVPTVPVIELSDMNSTQLSALATVMQTSSLPAAIVQAVSDQATLAPPPPPPGESAPVVVIEDTPPVQNTTTTVSSPTTAIDTSTGGGGTTTTDTTSTITQTLQRLVEAEVTEGPSQSSGSGQ